MKRNALVSGTLLLLIVSACICAPAFAAETSDEQIISVSGTGKVTATPDQVTISIAVETENPDVKVAQQENAKKMNDVDTALRAIGLTSDELKTTGYSIYSFTNEDNSLFGKDQKIYRVTNTVLVTTQKTDMAGEIIDTAIANGANNVNYISFSLTDETYNSLRTQALTAAVVQAKVDADAVSSALGVSITGVSGVNVGSSYVPNSYQSADMYMEKAAGAAPMPMARTTIQPGDVDVTASVSIQYFFR